MNPKTLTLGLAATLLAGISLFTSVMPAEACDNKNQTSFLNGRFNNGYAACNPNLGDRNFLVNNAFNMRGNNKFTPQQRMQRKLARKAHQQQVLQQQALQQIGRAHV